MTTETYPQPESKRKYSIYTTDEMISVLRAVASERITMSINNGQEPKQSDRFFVNLDTNHFKVSELQDIRQIAERLYDFIADTDRSTTQIRTEYPQAIADQFCEERKQLSDQAVRLAEKLDQEYQYLVARDTSGIDPDEWLRSLTE